VVADIHGPVGDPRIVGRIRIPELGLPEAVAQDVSIDGQWAAQKLRLDDIQARFGAGWLKARLEAASISGGDASVALELCELVLPGALAGVGPGTGVVEGRVHDGAVDLLRAHVNWRGLAASFDGRIAAQPSLALRAKLVADLRELGRAMSLGALGGRTSLSAGLSSRGPSPAIEGRSHIARLAGDGLAVTPLAGLPTKVP